MIGLCNRHIQCERGMAIRDSEDLTSIIKCMLARKVIAIHNDRYVLTQKRKLERINSYVESHRS